VSIARPIAASAAATTNMNKENIWPDKSFKRYEKPMKFMFAERSISSIDIKIVIIFFLFIKIPRKPIEKTHVDNTKK
jgi:hypothetical protein